MGRIYAIGLFVVSVIALLTVSLWPRHRELAELPSTTLPTPGVPIPAPPPELSSATLGYATTAQLVISAVLLAAALFVILTKKYPPQDKHWAYGALGTIVGFWLKAPG